MAIAQTNIFTAKQESWSAALGCLAWMLALLVLSLGWAEALLLFAVLVLLPACWPLLSGTQFSHDMSRLWPAACWIRHAAALALIGSFALPSGLLAALLAIPWCLWTFLIALLGVRSLSRTKVWTIGSVCLHAGLIYLAVGGTWTVIARSGWRPLGFRDIIVLATAVHFHYAGFVLPLLTALAVGHLRDALSRSAALGVVVGVPLVATGITLSAFRFPIVEWLAAWILAGACIAVAVCQVRLAIQAPGWMARACFVVSGVSLMAAMVLAGLYGLRAYWEVFWLDIPEMLPFHGAVNAFGFALPGLAGWRLAARADRGAVL